MVARLRRIASSMGKAIGFIAGLGAWALVAGACTKNAAMPPGGGLEIVVETDMAIPQDIDHVTVQVTQQGQSLLSVDSDVGAGALLIPATFDVKSTGNPTPVTVKGVGFKNGLVRVERDAVTPFPDGYLGELRLPLDYLCVGTAELDTDGGVSSTCPGGMTCVQGSCMTSTVPSSAVPTYNPSSVYGGGDGGAGSEAGGEDGTLGGCFDVQDCFAAATPATVNETACSLPLPAGVTSGANLNVALQFPVGGDGVCGTAACWVVFSAGSDWTLSGGTVQLPQAACTGPAAQGATVVVTTACAAKTESAPECGSWSPVTTPQPTVPGSGVGSSCSGPSSQSCGLCGTQSRTCTNGTWSAWGSCTGEGVCQANATQSCSTTLAGGSQTCTGECQWGTCACASDQSMCPGAAGAAPTCVATGSDEHNCGACGNDCTLLSHVSAAGVACAAGQCTYTCTPGYADCGDAGTGCATSLAVATSCGGCGVACPTDAPACTATSDAGAVDAGAPYACTTGCPSMAPTLCAPNSCVDLQSNPDNCGACGTICPVPAGGMATCSAAACGSTCPAGDELCGSTCVNEQTDSNNCGACGTVCATTDPNASGATCNGAGVCTTSCNAGFTLCSGTCVSEQTNSSNCGACGMTCPAGLTCQAGVCACAIGTSSCDGTCVDELTNSANCGGCGVVCTAGTTCQGGGCTLPSNGCTGATCVDNGNGTVSDNFSGLMWQQVVPDQLFTLAEAIAYCPTLTLAGDSDWFLPSLVELESIVDPLVSEAPFINTAVFGTTGGTFWTATGEFVVDFQSGQGFNGAGNAVLEGVRCARTLP